LLAEALDFIHRCGVIHGDINGFNVLLNRHLDVKLADFAGSSLDGSALLICVTASHEYSHTPRLPEGTSAYAATIVVAVIVAAASVLVRLRLSRGHQLP
jgi:serine/threonine protein kinase